MQRPIPERTLKADLALKGLTLKEAARRAGINYSVACSIINGKRIEPDRLRKLRSVISSARALTQAAPR